MKGRAFLHVAQTSVRSTTEPYWRATIIHAYYALFLECRDALSRWGIAIALHRNVHSAVRLRFLYAADPSVKKLGDALDRWCRKRNDASYNLNASLDFATNRLAHGAIQEIAAALNELDAIEADPARLASAIATFPP